MNKPLAADQVSFEMGKIVAINDAFLNGRRLGQSVPDFPGLLPADLCAAYAIQDRAITAWNKPIIGWKVGRILSPQDKEYGADRLIGPIFDDMFLKLEAGQGAVFGAINGGFCAVEAEYVFELGQDGPDEDVDIAGALALVSNLYVGIEIAGSPLATINEIGPLAVVSDFGNNAGLILGENIDNWAQKIEDLGARTDFDGAEIGTGHVRNFTGGIAESLRFAVNLARARGLTMKKGTLISTGAVSGVHAIAAGQTSICQFFIGQDEVKTIHADCTDGGHYFKVK